MFDNSDQDFWESMLSKVVHTSILASYWRESDSIGRVFVRSTTWSLWFPLLPPTSLEGRTEIGTMLQSAGGGLCGELSLCDHPTREEGAGNSIPSSLPRVLISHRETPARPVFCWLGK